MAAATALSACVGAAGPSPVEPTPYDEDDPSAEHAVSRAAAATPQPTSAAREPVALPTADTPAGEIERADLDQVLDAGPGRFLAGIVVEPVFRDGRFSGWQLVRFRPTDARIARAPLADGDIVMAVNARSIARPQQLQKVWDELRTASELVIAGERAGASFELRYAIRATQP